MTPYQSWLKRCVTAPLVLFASLLLWIEESLWVWLKRITALVSALAVVRRLEAAIVQLPPYATMVVFLLPMTILFPFKLMAVYWLTRGYWLASLMTILSAKVLGTAIVARMYVVCHPKLMTIGWFKWLHDFLISTRNRLYAAVNALPIFQAIKLRLHAIKLVVRNSLEALRRRWSVLRRWYRRNSSP